MRKRFGYGHNGKLVRDKSIEYCLKADKTSKFSYRYLTKEELPEHLFNKLQEEVLEILKSKNKEQICEEIVDVLDIISAIRKHHNIAKKDIITVQKNKHKLRGKFDTGLFIEWQEIDFPSDTEGGRYVLANADKYPELVIPEI